MLAQLTITRKKVCRVCYYEIQDHEAGHDGIMLAYFPFSQMSCDVHIMNNTLISSITFMPVEFLLPNPKSTEENWFQGYLREQFMCESTLMTTKSRLVRTISRWFLNISMDGDSTTPLGNLYLCLVTPTVKRWGLMFRGNCLCFSFWPLSLVLTLKRAWLQLLYTIPSDI